MFFLNIFFGFGAGDGDIILFIVCLMRVCMSVCLSHFTVYRFFYCWRSELYIYDIWNIRLDKIYLKQFDLVG